MSRTCKFSSKALVLSSLMVRTNAFFMKKTKETKKLGSIARLVESASVKHFTLDAEQLMQFANMVIDTIAKEYRALGKATVMNGEQALAQAKDIYLDADGNLDEEVDFLCDQEAMESIYETIYTLMTQDQDYKSEADAIIEKIKKNEKFAHDFLYGTSHVPGKSIDRLRSRIINQIRMSYGEVVEPDVFSTQLYEHLYSNGTWRPLATYNYRSTFYHWLSTVASRCIMSYLKDNNLIKVAHVRTPGNTRLKLKDKSPDYCYIVITDLLEVGQMRDMLLAVYVDRLDKEAIRERFKMDEDMYLLTLCASEKMLKTALLNNEHPYDDVLVDKSARKIMLPADNIALSNVACISDSPLREVLGITPDDDKFETKVIDFLYNFSNKLDWSSEDKYVWQSRFIMNLKPDVVAENLSGRSRPWVDNRYSILNRKFKTEIRQWWSRINV